MNNPDLLLEISADAEPIPVPVTVIGAEIQKLTLVAQQAGQELDEITFSTRFNSEGRLILNSQGISLKFRRLGTVTAPPVSEARPIAPVVDAYAPLRAALAQSNWQLANLETWNLLCQGLKKAPRSPLSREDVARIPCEVLQQIDRLWQQYSQGKFGFSVQQQLFKQ